MRALGHANRLIDWQQNLTEEEHPPEWMLPHDEELTHWFDRVKEKRSSSNSSPDDDNDTEPVGGMMQNELARGRR